VVAAAAASAACGDVGNAPTNAVGARSFRALKALGSSAVGAIVAEGLVAYSTVNVDLYSAIITKVSNALNTLVSREKSIFSGPV